LLIHFIIRKVKSAPGSFYKVKGNSLLALHTPLNPSPDLILPFYQAFFHQIFLFLAAGEHAAVRGGAFDKAGMQDVLRMMGVKACDIRCAGEEIIEVSRLVSPYWEVLV
jgi:hypothetical protein